MFINNIEPDELKFNGNEVDEVFINGIEVWSSGYIQTSDGYRLFSED